jgi:hypothetical protein
VAQRPLFNRARSSPEEFADVNEAVGEEWGGRNDTHERIRHVVAHTHPHWLGADANAIDATKHTISPTPHVEESFPRM